MNDKNKKIDKVESKDSSSVEEVVSSDDLGSDKVESKDSSSVEEVVSSDDLGSDKSGSMVDYNQVSIFGKKLGMSRVFIDDGNKDCPVTVVEAVPCYVTQLKTMKTDGYNSVQISYGFMKDKKVLKSVRGHFKKAGVTPSRYLKEFKVEDTNQFSIGDEINVSAFKEGELVKVLGKSIGKGFTGHMKRHGFGGGRKSHGKNSVMRKAGSIGAGTDPGRVWKGTRMAGRSGGENISIKNISVIKVDKTNNLIYLKGSVPGASKGLIFISK